MYLPFALATVMLSSAFAAHAETRTVQQSYALPLDGRVVIDNYKGTITVRTWDKPRVDLRADIVPDMSSPEMVNQTEIRIDAAERSLHVKTVYPNRDGSRSFWEAISNWSLPGNNPLVNYTLSIPASATLRIKDYKSEIHLSGLRGPLDVETYKGDMDLSDLAGALHVTTYKGTARVSFSKFTQSSSLETYKGDIDIRIPRETGFQVHSRVGRRADVSSDFAAYLPAGNQGEMRGRINGGGPTLELKGQRGSFRVRSR